MMIEIKYYARAIECNRCGATIKVGERYGGEVHLGPGYEPHERIANQHTDDPFLITCEGPKRERHYNELWEMDEWRLPGFSLSDQPD